MSELFYYDEEYPMQVGEAAKNLLLARDNYLKAWWNWTTSALGGSIADELEAIEQMMIKVQEEHKD